MEKKKVGFASGIGFILAAAGSAVGLGNLWGFPYKTSQNGGAAFVLLYVACVIFIGFVTMLSEIYIGRRAAFEILMVNREVRRLVNDDAAYDELLAAAKKNGYRTMRDSCRDLVLRGITTAEEAARTINSTLDE